MTTTTYSAPWSASLIIISSLCTMLCVGVAVRVAWQTGGLPPPVALIPVIIIVAGALFIVRGYTVTNDAILVHRLLWTTRLPLQELRDAKFAPGAMRQSLRLFGNGGLFSFSGWFRNRTLGTYRALVTDPRRTVVLEFGERTVLVSPSSPQDFVRKVGDTIRGRE